MEVHVVKTTVLIRDFISFSILRSFSRKDCTYTHCMCVLLVLIMFIDVKVII